jgi:hypothetical protein
MRPTKSKEQLAYYKHLLAIDKKRNELSNRKDDEDNYIEIPRTKSLRKVILNFWIFVKKIL